MCLRGKKGVELFCDGLMPSVEVVAVVKAERSKGIVTKEEGLLSKGRKFSEVEGKKGSRVGKAMTPGTEALVIDFPAEDSGVYCFHAIPSWRATSMAERTASS